MIKYILDGITNAIYEQFGDGYNIHVNPEEQGVDEPCFFVYLMKSDEYEKTMGRYFQHNPFHIVYFPRTEEQAREETGYYEPNNECYEVLRQLLSTLRYITLADGSVVRGTNLSGEVSDKRLSFYVDYDLYVNRRVGGIAMESLIQDPRKV